MKKAAKNSMSVIEIDDCTFDLIMQAHITNRRNWEIGKIKWMQMEEQNDYILERQGVSKKDWIHALNVRSGVHNRVEKKVVAK